MLNFLFATALSVSAVAKGPHFFFIFIFSLGPLLDWSGQILLLSHWSTQTECSTHAEFVAIAVAGEGMAIPQGDGPPLRG